MPKTDVYEMPDERKSASAKREGAIAILGGVVGMLFASYWIGLLFAYVGLYCAFRGLVKVKEQQARGAALCWIGGVLSFLYGPVLTVLMLYLMN